MALDRDRGAMLIADSTKTLTKDVLSMCCLEGLRRYAPLEFLLIRWLVILLFL